MPTHQCLGTDDRENLQDRRKPPIQLDKEPAIAVCELDTATQLAPQNNQLMSKHRVLSLKPHLRLEWRGQDGQDETQKPDHSASLGDSVTSSTTDRVFGTHRATNSRGVSARRSRCGLRTSSVSCGSTGFGCVVRGVPRM